MFASTLVSFTGTVCSRSWSKKFAVGFPWALLFKKLKQEVSCLFPLRSFVQEVEVRSLLLRDSRTWTKPWYWLLDSSLGYILVFQLSKWEVGIIAQKECSLWVRPLILQPAFWGAVTCVSVCIYVCLFQWLQLFNSTELQSHELYSLLLIFRRRVVLSGHCYCTYFQKLLHLCCTCPVIVVSSQNSLLHTVSAIVVSDCMYHIDL
jgi:hypothetical protein